MSTVQLIGPRSGALDAHERSLASASNRVPRALAGALLSLLLYAAFSHGAVAPSVEVRMQVAIAALAALAGSAWVWSGTLRMNASPVAYAGVGLLSVFALWSAISLLWSVSPSETWLELNRTITYVIVLGLALLLGASYARSVELIAKGFLLVALSVTVYALGQKLFPGFRLDGLFNLNQNGPLPRLQEPLGYWNALALFITMAVAPALLLAVDRNRSRHTRLGASVALELMLLAIAFTYSRGGLIALVVALALAILLSRARLRSLMWLLAPCIAMIPPLVFGLTSHSLTAAGVSLDHREAAGAELAVVLLLSAVALLAGSRKLLELEQRVVIDAGRIRRVHQGLLSLVAVAVVIALAAMALSSRGLDGTVSHAWKSFTATRGTSVYDPQRLLSTDSENRWVWWKEAAGAFSDRPLAGWGAGSFGVVHLLYRRDALSVKQPHSVPLQWLAETGLIGALLAILAFALLLAAAITAVRRRAPGSERLLATALLAGIVAYAVHALYDWDWDIPGVTLPALVLIGVLVGAYRTPSHQLQAWGLGTRALVLAALALCLCAFALSAAVPSIAASQASAALISADRGSLADANASATLASRLDPVSDAGPRAEATIALHRGQLHRASAYLLDAVRRQPADVEAWRLLVGLDDELGDVADARRALDRTFALDPIGQRTGFREGAQQTILSQTPPQDSPTAAPLR